MAHIHAGKTSARESSSSKVNSFTCRVDGDSLSIFGKLDGLIGWDVRHCALRVTRDALSERSGQPIDRACRNRPHDRPTKGHREGRDHGRDPQERNQSERSTACGAWNLERAHRDGRAFSRCSHGNPWQRDGRGFSPWHRECPPPRNNQPGRLCGVQRTLTDSARSKGCPPTVEC